MKTTIAEFIALLAQINRLEDDIVAARRSKNRSAERLAKNELTKAEHSAALIARRIDIVRKTEELIEKSMETPGKWIDSDGVIHYGIGNATRLWMDGEYDRYCDYCRMLDIPQRFGRTKLPLTWGV